MNEKTELAEINELKLKGFSVHLSKWVQSGYELKPFKSGMISAIPFLIAETAEDAERLKNWGKR